MFDKYLGPKRKKYLFFKKLGFGKDYVTALWEGIKTAGKCKIFCFHPNSDRYYCSLSDPWKTYDSEREVRASGGSERKFAVGLGRYWRCS